MPFCHKCGKANLEDARFCEACGARLGAVAAAATAPATVPSIVAPVPVAPAPAAATVIVSAAETVETSAAVETPASIRCYSCTKPTPAGLAFCQNCGSRLAAQAVPGRGAPTPAPVARSNGSERVDPAATVKLEPSAPVAAAPVTPSVAAAPVVAPVPVPPPTPKVEPQPIARVETVSKPESRMTPSAGVRVVPAGITRSEPRIASGPARGRVVVVQGGRDVEAHVITGDTFDVGRSEGQLVISNDAHLGPRHARFTTPVGSPAKVRPLDTVNGVFLRVHGGVDLVPGDVILVARQLLRYESVGSEERDPPTVAEHGVRLLGSVTREAWGRLRQLTSAGTTRDMWHLCATEITIGRRGEVSSDDPDLADRHAVVRRGTGRARLEDLGSPGGTFVRLRGERELRGGELLRMGEQLVRFEPAVHAGQAGT